MPPMTADAGPPPSGPLLPAPAGWHAAAAGPRGAWLRPGAVFDGRVLRPGLGLHVAGGRVQALAPVPAGAAPVWASGGICAPGFVDLQVNGGGGVLFNAQPTAEGALAIARAHRSTGTAALLPTVLTDAPGVMAAAAAAVADVLGREGIIGIHIEGPHISLARRGTHAAAHVRPYDAQTEAVVTGLRRAGVPVMLTVAPEAMAPGQIARLAGMGVVVALGHSDADAAATRAALAEGAATFTHLFNAMSPMQNRAPGMTGAAINSAAHASVICDGIHVDPGMLALAIRARPLPDRMLIVTDAMPTVAGPDDFTLYGQTIRLQAGRLVNAEGALAGAHVTMLQSCAMVAVGLGLGAEAALRMAISVPAGLMGLPHLARPEGRPLADLRLMTDDFAALAFADARPGA